MLLVLITSLPRSYDQTFILDQTFFWVFGPLLFSTFSGTLIFGCTYSVFFRPGIEKQRRLPQGTAWRSFMGLFWMTAPIAWIYAIPVERFLQSFSAAMANIALLLVVSVWRVALMNQVLSVMTGLSKIKTLPLLLIPICLEVRIG